MEWAYIAGGIAALLAVYIVWKKIENIFDRGDDKKNA